MFLTREFTFSAAHQLTHYHGKCERLHGHNYRLAVTVKGDVAKNGLVIDFLILKSIVRKHVLDQVDHSHLNDLFENPTAERIAFWIWDQLKNFDVLLREERSDSNLSPEIQRLLEQGEAGSKDVTFGVTLYEIKLWETDDAYVSVRENLDR